MIKTSKKIFILLCFNLFCDSLAINHWIVTQTGKIQAYLETPFDLRRPYDLLALLDQETRRNDINELYDDLINRKVIIETKWAAIDKNSNIGLKITSQDADCQATTTIFSDLDLYGNIASNGTERNTFTLSIPKKYTSSVLHYTPNCNNYGKLRRKEDSESSSLNKTIRLHSDETLKKKFVPVSLETYGHYISNALTKNSTSWVHYNMGSIYWRIKNDGNKAVDCIKLAIQHVTDEYRDIPLYNLAGILHQARHSREAAKILQRAVDMAPHQAIHYLALGNIYAALGDYNVSIEYYDKYLHMHPSETNVAANRHAILCYSKLENGLTNLQKDLQQILTQLHDYHSMQQQWLRLQERLMWEHASFDYQYEGIHPALLAGEASRKIQRCIQKTSENTNKPVISCDFYDKGPDLEKLNLQNLFQFVENEKQKLSEQIGRATAGGAQESADDSGDGHSPPAFYPKFPTSMSSNGNQYFDVTGWPKKEECLQWDLPVSEKEDLNLPLFLPPENKGYHVKAILSEQIGLAEGSQHELPWYPPLCGYANVNGEKYVPTSERHILDNEIKYNSYFRNILIKYVNEGKVDEAEIGQRIITAMEKKVAPKWLLATLASLYWRVRGNARKAMDCLDMAFQLVPKESTDIVLLSLGSMMYQLGFADQAMKFATLAFKINYVEPSTNFLLSLLHYKNNNPLLAMYYMKNVLRVEPDFYDEQADKLLKIWACRIKLGTSYKVDDEENLETTHATCIRSDSAVKGEGMVCTRDGDDCKTATIQCYKKVDASDLIKTLNIQEDPRCVQTKEKANLGQTIISSLLAAEGSGDLEPDQSRLETLVTDPKQMPPNIHHHVHMRLSLGEDHPFKEHAAIGDFYVSVALSDEVDDDENKLHVYDKYGTYTLSALGCKDVPIMQKFKYSLIWPSIVSRSPDISGFIKPIPKEYKGKDLKPFCVKVFNLPMPYNLDKFTKSILDRRLPSSPEKDLSELLGLMSSNPKLSVKELGFRMTVALKREPTSWLLLTASSVYWRIIGNSEQAVLCLRAALTQVASDMLDVPLMHLANLLNRMGFHKDALDMGTLAMKVRPNFVMNHFTLANIHVTMGEYEKAVAFFRACLAIDQNFEPARQRLKAVLCSLLFDDTNNAQQATNIARKVIQIVD